MGIDFRTYSSSLGLSFFKNSKNVQGFGFFVFQGHRVG